MHVICHIILSACSTSKILIPIFTSISKMESLQLLFLVYQIIETTINRSTKYTGGLSGKTENVRASEKWMRINHIMAALREHLDSVIRKKTGSENIDCGMKGFLSDENDVKMLSQTLEEWFLNLWTSEQRNLSL